MNKTDRPFIFCHMETSLDGKIMGKYLWIPETNTENDVFYKMIFGPEARFQYEATLEGRITIEDNYTYYKKPELDENAAPVPAGDYLAPGAALGVYQLVMDTHGRICWPKNTLEESGRTMHVVEVLTEATPNAYKAYLRSLGISYLICGTDKPDLELLCKKAKDLLHVESMMLAGGGTINWSFVQAGLVDEMSIVMAPAADGNPDTQPMFLAKPGLSTDAPVVFKLLDVEKLADDFLWLHYAVGPKNTYDFDNDPEYKQVQDRIKANRGK